MLTHEEMVANLLVKENRPAEPSAELLAAAWAIPDEEVRRVNVDPPQVVSILLAAAGKVPTLRDRIAVLTPATDLAELDRLEPNGTALYWAHLLCLAQPLPPNTLQALAEEGIRLRRRLRADSVPLEERGLIPPGSLKECQGRPGVQNISTELGLLVTVLREAWTSIQGKCAIEEAELERARRISQALLRHITMKEEASAQLAKAKELRARIFTLALRCYEQVRRAVQYVRYFEKDAEEFAPSVYGGRQIRRAEEEPAQAQEPAASKGEGAASPAGSVFGAEAAKGAGDTERSAAAAPVGRGEEPFME